MVGEIAGVFGIHGELKCDPTAAGRSVLLTRTTLRCQLKDRSVDVVLCAIRHHKRRFIVSLENCTDANDALRFVGARLYASASKLNLGPGEFLDRDLIGAAVVDERNAHLGRVSDVEHFPSSDMLVLGKNRIPLVRAFILSIDTKAKRIVVRVPLGLLDDASMGEA